MFSATATSLTISASAKTLEAGAALTLTATVDAAGGATVSEGSVTFFDSAAALGSAMVSNGTATLDVASLNVGDHAITADYTDAAGVFAASISGVSVQSSTAAVAGSNNGDGDPASLATLYGPGAMASDAAGDIFMADAGRVREINHSTGVITTVAGGGPSDDNANGRVATQIDMYAQAVDVNAAGTLLFVATSNEIREVNLATGIVNTIAGGATAGDSGDGGPATSAELDFPQGLALSGDGLTLYVADTRNNAIREINLSTGIIQTLDVPKNELSAPQGIALDSSGNLFIANTAAADVVEWIAATGSIAAVTGKGVSGFGGDGDGGPATAAYLSEPTAIAFDATGDLFIADEGNDNRVREIHYASGVITTFAGGGEAYQAAGDGGAATAAELETPDGLAFDPAGNLYIADSDGERVREVNPSGIISTAAGDGSTTYGGDNGAATSATLDSPMYLTFDTEGDMFIADFWNNVVREVVKSTGDIVTVAGDGIGGDGQGDGGPATSAAVGFVTALVVDSSGDLFIAGADTVREVNHATRIITTIAGDGASSYFLSGDGGPATSAPFGAINALAINAAGNLFISDWGNHCVREVNMATGIINTVAGDGTAGYAGDGGPATAAELYDPDGLAFDAKGDLFISDLDTDTIREVSVSTGIITTFAGNGGCGKTGDGGAATSATLMGPAALAFDPDGDLFFIDSGQLREINLAGVITSGGDDDDNGLIGEAGVNLFPQFRSLADLAFDASGNLYEADYLGNRVQMITAGIAVDVVATPVVELTSTPAPVTVATAAAFSFTANEAGQPSSSLTFEVRLDGGPLTTATGSVNYSSLSAGTHTLYVNGVDSSGNSGPVVSYEWTIDDIGASSYVESFGYASTSSPFLDVGWSGTDNLQYDQQELEDLASYTIFVSIDGGPYTAWLSNTTQTSATYVAEFGHTYAFYSVANDVDGLSEAPPATPDATITVTASPFPPTSSVASLPLRTSLTSFPVSWSGTPGADAWAISSYNIYVSVNGGPYSVWLRNTSNVSANYTAQLGDTYSFTSQATDNLDDTEAVHTSADATITTAQYPWHNSSNPLDVLGRGTVTPLDALAEIDYINANGLGPLPASVPVGDYDVDVAGTNNLTPLDLLQIIDYLNAHIGDESAVADQPATAFAAASGSSAAAPASPASALGAVAGAAVGELGQESSIPSAIPAAMAVPAASLSPASTVPAATGGVPAATGGASAGSGPAGNTRPTLKLAAVDRAMADESVDW